MKITQENTYLKEQNKKLQELKGKD
jgi:hypothetical protein